MGGAISDLVIAVAVRQHLAARAHEKTFLLATDTAAGRHFGGDHVCDDGRRAVGKSIAGCIKKRNRPKKKQCGEF